MNSFTDIIPPEPPTQLIGVGVGVGKSYEARKQVQSIVPTLPSGSCLVIAAPTHALNDEHAQQLKELLEDDGVNVAVYRGRNAADPIRSGRQMCDHADEAAEVASVGGDPKQLCSRRKGSRVVRCGSFDECGYRRQDSHAPSVWIVPHAVLTRKPPKCISNVAALIIDEDPLQTFLEGFDHPVRVSLDEIKAFRFATSNNVVGDAVMNIAATADLEAAAKGLEKVLSELEGNEAAIPISSLLNAGITAELMFGIQRAVLDGKTKVDIAPDMPPDRRKMCIKEAAIINRPILRLARLYRLIGRAISSEHIVVPGCRFERGVQSGSGPQYDAVRLRWVGALHERWHAPTMILSATAQPELLKPIWPQIEHVANVNPITPHMSVRQVSWSASKAKLKNENHLDRLKRYIEVRAFEYRGQGTELDDRKVDVLVITQMEAEEALNALTLPDNVDTAHFNAVEGIDKWGGVACIICIGRTMPPPDEVELMAEVLTGAIVERDEDFEGGWYPRKFTTIRMKGAGNFGPTALTEVHPHGIAEAIRRSICEAGLVQAIGRGRGVNREKANPLQTDIIGTLPLPLEIDEILDKNAIDPDPFAVMAARGLVVDEKATKGKWQIVQKVLPELFASSELAKKALKGNISNKKYKLAEFPLSGFTPATVKLEGARYAVPVQIDASRGDPRALAERLLGPLALFKQFPVKTTKPRPS